MASRAQANPALERRIQREVERAVQGRQRDAASPSPSPTAVSTSSASPNPSASPVMRVLDTFQNAQEVDQTAPALPSPFTDHNQEKVYGSILGDTFILHRLPEGQLLLTVRPTTQLVGVVAGVIATAVVLITLKKILTRRTSPHIKRYKIKRIDL